MNCHDVNKLFSYLEYRDQHPLQIYGFSPRKGTWFQCDSRNDAALAHTLASAVKTFPYQTVLDEGEKILTFISYDKEESKFSPSVLDAWKKRMGNLLTNLTIDWIKSPRVHDCHKIEDQSKAIEIYNTLHPDAGTILRIFASIYKLPVCVEEEPFLLSPKEGNTRLIGTSESLNELFQAVHKYRDNLTGKY